MSCKKCAIGATGNTGIPGGVVIQGDTKMIFAAIMTADDGTPFEIAEGTEITDAFIEALINHPDPTKRLYPIAGYRNVSEPAVDPLITTYDDGSAEFVSGQPRTFTATLPLLPATFIGQLRNLAGCRAIGIFEIDKCKNWEGDISKPLFIKPIPVSPGSWYGLLEKATATLNQSIRHVFQIDPVFQDENRGSIDGSTIEADILNVRGLKDIKLEIVSATAATDTVVFKANSIYGFPKISISSLTDSDLQVSVNGVGGVFSSVTYDMTTKEYTGTTAADFSVSDSIIISGSKTGFDIQDSVA